MGRGLNTRSLIRNAATAFSAQGVSMLVSIVVTLLVPKVLGVESFGYWQLFVLYGLYSQFFMLGLFDGVYLAEGGKRRRDLDARSVATQYVLCACTQIAIGIAIALFATFTASLTERTFVLCAFAAYLVLYNLTLALGYVFQAVNETRTFSYSVMLDRLAFLVPLVALVALGVGDFRVYILFYLAAKAIALSYCFWKARDILSAGFYSLSEGVGLCAASIRVGVKLTVAVVTDTLILGGARMLIDFVWGIEVFSEVSFALSLINFFVAFVAQASMVLFPALRQSSDDSNRRAYVLMRDVLAAFFPVVYLLYFPGVVVLTAWLPQYAESMRYLALLLPICAFDSKMNICSATYMKVLRGERKLLSVNVATLAVAAGASLAGAFLIGSPDAVVLGVTGCIVARSLYSEAWLDRKLRVGASPLTPAELVLTCCFVGLSLFLDAMPGLLAYALLYFAYLFMGRTTVRSVVVQLKSVLLKRGS